MSLRKRRPEGLKCFACEISHAFFRFSNYQLVGATSRRPPEELGTATDWRRRLVQLLLLYLSPRWTVWRSTVGDMTADRENFRKRLLVFGCVVADLCKPIRALQHFQKCTRLSNWNCRTWTNQNLQDLQKWCWIFTKSADLKTDCFRYNFGIVAEYANLEVCKSCRSWKMLSNAFLCKISLCSSRERARQDKIANVVEIS